MVGAVPGCSSAPRDCGGWFYHHRSRAGGQPLSPAVLERCVYAHSSGEPGHTLMLLELRAEPLLDWQLRLGEGSAPPPPGRCCLQPVPCAGHGQFWIGGRGH